jgi:hypothetical protein
MPSDIRTRARLNHKDIVGLNFIRAMPPYVFRRHYRMGLRSHIMEVLRPDDLARETEGVPDGPLTWFPKARPLKVLRIFRTRFQSLADAEAELRTVKIVERYLAPDLMARSNEFLVHYRWGNGRDLLLCGLQEYVEGEILDPWSPMTGGRLDPLFRRMRRPGEPGEEHAEGEWLHTVRRQGEMFVRKIKEMIHEAGHVPDLAGVGNLLITPRGEVKLVDINNISKVVFDGHIRIDDRGYPVCDKSVEALFLLEEGLLHRPPNRTEKIYETFLDPHRMRDVRAVEREFHLTVGKGYPPLLRGPDQAGP